MSRGSRRGKLKRWDWLKIHQQGLLQSISEQALTCCVCQPPPPSTSLHHPNNLQISVLPSEKLMSPRRCRSLMEANTNTTMPTVCSPSVSQIAFSITPPSAHSPPPYPDPNPEPEPASSTSGPPPGPGPPFPPGPALQFPCTNSSATPAQTHGPGAPWHPPSARLFSKSTLGKVKIGD